MSKLTSTPSQPTDDDAPALRPTVDPIAHAERMAKEHLEAAEALRRKKAAQPAVQPGAKPTVEQEAQAAQVQQGLLARLVNIFMRWIRRLAAMLGLVYVVDKKAEKTTGEAADAADTASNAAAEPAQSPTESAEGIPAPSQAETKAQAEVDPVQAQAEFERRMMVLDRQVMTMLAALHIKNAEHAHQVVRAVLGAQFDAVAAQPGEGFSAVMADLAAQGQELPDLNTLEGAKAFMARIIDVRQAFAYEEQAQQQVLAHELEQRFGEGASAARQHALLDVLARDGVKASMWDPEGRLRLPLQMLMRSQEARLSTEAFIRETVHYLSEVEPQWQGWRDEIHDLIEDRLPGFDLRLKPDAQEGKGDSQVASTAADEDNLVVNEQHSVPANAIEKNPDPLLLNVEVPSELSDLSDINSKEGAKSSISDDRVDTNDNSGAKLRLVNAAHTPSVANESTGELAGLDKDLASDNSSVAQIGVLCNTIGDMEGRAELSNGSAQSESAVAAVPASFGRVARPAQAGQHVVALPSSVSGVVDRVRSMPAAPLSVAQLQQFRADLRQAGAQRVAEREAGRSVERQRPGGVE